MIETAKRYNDYTERRHFGVTRIFTRDNSRVALGYSSLNHTVTHWNNGVKVLSVEFPSAEVARDCWRGLQRTLVADGYTYEK